MEANQALVIPPGWVCACTVLKKAPLFGIKKLFLPTGKQSLDAFTLSHKLNPYNKAVKSTLDCLTIAEHTGGAQTT